MLNRPIVQIAYLVNDIEAAAKRMNALLGAGPFFVSRHIPLAEVYYRGQLATLDHSSAFGQAGEIMVELAHQHDDKPSAFRDMYGVGEEGLHHMATFVDDFDSELARLEELGCLAANIAATANGVRFAYVDTTSTLGHMLEIYQGDDGLRNFYKMVKDAAEDWDGQELLRYLN